MAIRFPRFGQQKSSEGAKAAGHTAELEVENVGRFAVNKVTTVGRAPESQICLNVRSVSRNHARLFFEGGHYWIKDLGSANGTRVNGQKVKLQMLSDQDKVSFGEAKAIFRCGHQATGPALVAEDPLEGSDALVPDGTPTGGLGEGPLGAREKQKRDRRADRSAKQRTMAPGTGGSELQTLTKKVEMLQAENERLRGEICHLRAAATHTGSAPASGSDSQEVERLRKLVAQLERALADSNTRLRNLQQRLDPDR